MNKCSETLFEGQVKEVVDTYHAGFKDKIFANFCHMFIPGNLVDFRRVGHIEISP